MTANKFSTPNDDYLESVLKCVIDSNGYSRQEIFQQQQAHKPSLRHRLTKKKSARRASSQNLTSYPPRPKARNLQTSVLHDSFCTPESDNAHPFKDIENSLLT